MRFVFTDFILRCVFVHKMLTGSLGGSRYRLERFSRSAWADELDLGFLHAESR